MMEIPLRSFLHTNNVRFVTSWLSSVLSINQTNKISYHVVYAGKKCAANFIKMWLFLKFYPMLHNA